VNEKKVAIFIGNMYKEMVGIGIPHPVVQGMLSRAIAMIYFQPSVEERVSIETNFKNIVKDLKLKEEGDV